MNSQQVKLERLVVSKLFGRFDYSIDLENEQSLTIITAPNGYGKTVILNVIKRFFNQEFYYFNNLQFKEIQIQFNNGRMIEIHKDTADLFAEEFIRRRNAKIKDKLDF